MTDYVLHKCDNPTCVSVAHLFLGDAGVNAQDCQHKGRKRTPSGAVHYSKTRPVKHERHSQAKLTMEKANEIRRLYAAGDHTHRSLAALFGVAHGAMSALINNKTWTHT